MSFLSINTTNGIFLKRHNVYSSITAVHGAVKTAPKLKTQESTDSDNANVLQPTIKNHQYSTEIKPLPLETNTRYI